MSERIDYGDPWRISKDEKYDIAYVVDCNDAVVCGDVAGEDAARIIACVNALAGIEDPGGAIAKARVVMRDVISNYLGVLDVVHMGQLESALSALAPKEQT